MSLGRLLAAGRSLVGLRDSGSRYRMEKSVSLPKFNSSRNPFAAASGRAVEDSNVGAASPSLPTPGMAAVDSNETRRLPAPVVVDRAARFGSVSRIGVRLSATVGQWVRRFNAPPPVSPRPTPPGPVRSGLAPVQGELCLDNVRVVRNDLTDADLEVVPMKPNVCRQNAEPVSPAGPARPAADHHWTRLAARLFGADAT